MHNWKMRQIFQTFQDEYNKVENLTSNFIAISFVMSFAMAFLIQINSFCVIWLIVMKWKEKVDLIF